MPFAFLEIEMPSLEREILFEDRMHKIKGCDFECREIKSKTGRVFPTHEFTNYFMPSDEHTGLLMVRDFDHDFEREELIIDAFYQAKVDEGDATKFRPNKQQ